MPARRSSSRRFLLRHKLLFGVAGAFAFVTVGVAIGFILLLSGAFTTAATIQHFPITYRILDAGLLYSVKSDADDLVAPQLGEGHIEQGAACYRQYCAQCHGSPGTAPEAHGLGLLPIPSNLAQSAREWPIEWLYYVTKRGIRMSGMPAWEFRMSDASLWSTAAFIKQLPLLDQEGYAQLDAASEAQCEPATQLPGGKDAAPHVVLRQYACDSCHLIEGMVGPRSHVGQPLVDWPRRKYIAGMLPNSRDNLYRWIRDPQAVNPDTLMPNLGVSEEHARLMVEHLFSQE